MNKIKSRQNCNTCSLKWNAIKAWPPFEIGFQIDQTTIASSWHCLQLFRSNIVQWFRRECEPIIRVHQWSQFKIILDVNTGWHVDVVLKKLQKASLQFIPEQKEKKNNQFKNETLFPPTYLPQKCRAKFDNNQRSKQLDRPKLWRRAEWQPVRYVSKWTEEYQSPNRWAIVPNRPRLWLHTRTRASQHWTGFEWNDKWFLYRAH